LIVPGQLRGLQLHLVDCILTRHSDGRVRQKSLAQIIGSSNPWVPAYVIQLLGEYEIEIIVDIEANLGILDARLYSQFLRANPDFFGLTERRVQSYWDCYYGSHKKDEYVGFRVLRFFKGLVESEN
jgi:hypothetical protein